MSYEFFVDKNFQGGSSGCLDKDYANLGSFWNDKISSIKVLSGTWEFFEHASYGGSSFRLAPGSYSWVTNAWNDKISSIRQVTGGASSPSTGMEAEILSAHNSYRSQVGSPPLRWSNALAAHAQEWANHLSATQSFNHSGVQGEGENLWIGSSGHFSFTRMIQRFGDEKQYFINGAFPNASTTGNWKDVGHYTQIIWHNTTEVGCAIARGNDGKDRLVCRYSPPGNVIGQKALPG